VKKKHRYSVYVVELSPKVWNHRRFRRSNPGHDVTKPCVYVGMTGLSPDVRFDKHKAGIQANRFVQLYGGRLLPKLVPPASALCQTSQRWRSPSSTTNQ